MSIEVRVVEQADSNRLRISNSFIIFILLLALFCVRFPLSNLALFQCIRKTRGKTIVMDKAGSKTGSELGVKLGVN